MKKEDNLGRNTNNFKKIPSKNYPSIYFFSRNFRLNGSRFGNSTIFGSLQIVLRRMVAEAVSAFANSFRNFGIIYWQKISALNSIQNLYIFKTSLICKSYDWVLGGFTLFVM